MHINENWKNIDLHSFISCTMVFISSSAGRLPFLAYITYYLPSVASKRERGFNNLISTHKQSFQPCGNLSLYKTWNTSWKDNQVPVDRWQCWQLTLGCWQLTFFDSWQSPVSPPLSPATQLTRPSQRSCLLMQYWPRGSHMWTRPPEKLTVDS